MKNGFQQTRDAVPRNSSSKRKKEILECDEFSLCEHVWTSVEAVRVQRIVAGFLRNINNVCGHWAIIEKGFKSFFLSWTQKPCIVNAFSDVDDKLVFISSAFCCQFSSMENHSALQQATLQLIQLSMLALLAFTKTTFYFCPIGPKVSFWLAFHCATLHKGRQLYIWF